MVFLVTSALALFWKKIRQIWKLDSFLWLPGDNHLDHVCDADPARPWR